MSSNGARMLRDSSRIGTSSHRHAAPSGPWPWIDFGSGPYMDTSQSHTHSCGHPDVQYSGWSSYPQSLFPNWTFSQVKGSGIAAICAESDFCTIHQLDVKSDGHFGNSLNHFISNGNEEEFWAATQVKYPEDVRVRVLFLQGLPFTMLQMIGTKYNIEPFYFSSTFNWIPSYYREDVRPAHGDHITITLTYLHTRKISTASPTNSSASSTNKTPPNIAHKELILHSNDYTQDDQILLLDLLAIHMIRAPGNNTIISYHHDPDIWQGVTSARHLHARVRLVGQSVYWQHIFKKSRDPTLVLLVILWHVLYVWDEALESLWAHISLLESEAIHSNDIGFTQELHTIQARLLHYNSLLEDFRSTVVFILETPNPTLDSTSFTDPERELANNIMKTQCTNLLTEIDRLMLDRASQNMRLNNVMNLTVSKIMLEDSKRTQQLTEVSVRDSAAMKQISYLTMFFLPASFTASVFGMNITELTTNVSGSLAQYVAVIIPLTLATVWILVALHGRWHVDRDGRTLSVWTRLWFPLIILGHRVWKHVVWGARILFRRRWIRRRDHGEGV